MAILRDLSAVTPALTSSRQPPKAPPWPGQACISGCAARRAATPIPYGPSRRHTAPWPFRVVCRRSDARQLGRQGNLRRQLRGIGFQGQQAAPDLGHCARMVQPRNRRDFRALLGRQCARHTRDTVAGCGYVEAAGSIHRRFAGTTCLLQAATSALNPSGIACSILTSGQWRFEPGDQRWNRAVRAALW